MAGTYLQTLRGIHALPAMRLKRLRQQGQLPSHRRKPWPTRTPLVQGFPCLLNNLWVFTGAATVHPVPAGRLHPRKHGGGKGERGELAGQSLLNLVPVSSVALIWRSESIKHMEAKCMIPIYIKELKSCEICEEQTVVRK